MKIEKALEIVRAYRRPVSLEKLRHSELPGSPGAEGFIYFVYCAGRVKIGYTADVDNRISTIMVHTPFPSILLMTSRGDLQDEAGFHARFQESRRHGEWFELTKEFRSFLVESMCASGRALLAKAEADGEDMLMEIAADVIERTAEEQEVMSGRWC